MFEHVIDPATNYHPVYSIEYVARENPDWTTPQAWAQFARTDNKWLARVLAVENWFRHSKNNKTRVRVL